MNIRKPTLKITHRDYSMEMLLLIRANDHKYIIDAIRADALNECEMIGEGVTSRVTESPEDWAVLRVTMAQVIWHDGESLEEMRENALHELLSLDPRNPLEPASFWLDVSTSITAHTPEEAVQKLVRGLPLGLPVTFDVKTHAKRFLLAGEDVANFQVGYKPE